MPAALLLAAALAAAAPAVRPADCFPVEQLGGSERAEAEALFLRILDSEALYTVAGGLKPVSSGFVRLTARADAGALPEVDRQRRLLAHFRCGDAVFATVHHFRALHEAPDGGGRVRYFDGIVMAPAAVRRTVARYEAEFAALGVSPHSHPMEVLLAVESADEAARWRGYGRLFGYPAEAVEFFVHAGVRQRETGQLEPRRFVLLPTFARPDRGLVYAVAADAPETGADAALRQAVEATLADYRQRRARYVGPGKPGVARLLRDWFCPDRRGCRLPAPAQAMSGSRKERSSPSRRQASSAAR